MQWSDPEIFLSVVVFGASMLQAATGIGFGVIAGPILLVALNDNSAIQISVLLNLLIAALISPMLRQQVDRALLKSLAIGLLIGSPLGFVLFVYLNVALLKMLAAAAVIFTLTVLVKSKQTTAGKRQAAGSTERIGIGVVAGMMGGSLAMPGPVPVAWMSANGFGKSEVRATILAMFVAAYLIALILNAAFAGIEMDTLKLAAILTPSTVAGIFAGQYVADKVSESTFRYLLMIILVLTATSLLVTAI